MVKVDQQVGADRGEGEEEPLPLPLLPLTRLERGGEGECGVRRQTRFKIQAGLSFTWIQIDCSDWLLSFLPGVDGHLGGWVEGGGGPVDCAGQGAVLNHLIAGKSQ